MSGDGALRSSWNVALITDILAPAYAAAVLAAGASLGPGDVFWRLFPTGDVPASVAARVSASHHSASRTARALQARWRHHGTAFWHRSTTLSRACPCCSRAPVAAAGSPWRTLW
jgi:hypothetical protein